MGQADAAVEAPFVLTAGMIEAELIGRPSAALKAGASQLDAAMAFIEQRYCDPALTPSTVAGHRGLSRSNL